MAKAKVTEKVLDAELVTQETTALAVRSQPDQLIRLAVEKDLDVEKLKRLMELQERWQKEQARIAFFEAQSKFQAIVPEIPKAKNVTYRTEKGTTSYNYAPLGDIDKAIKEPMRECGLSKRWEFNPIDGAIECICVVSHSLGHSERSRMVGGFDSSGGKNSIQSRGSTMTYLQRYTLIGALGLSTADEDNDGQDDDDDRQQRSGPPPQRPPSRRQAPEQKKADEMEGQPSKSERIALVESYQKVRDRLKEIAVPDLGAKLNAYAHEHDFGPIKAISSVPVDKMPGLIGYMKELLLKATAKPTESVLAWKPTESVPEPEEAQESTKTDDDPNGVPLSAEPLKSPWKALGTMCVTLKEHGVYKTNAPILARVNAILEKAGQETVTDLSKIDRRSLPTIMNELSAEIVKAKEAKK